MSRNSSLGCLEDARDALSSQSGSFGSWSQSSPLRLSESRSFVPEADWTSYTLADFGYTGGMATKQSSGSKFACTEPFALLTKQASQAIREQARNGGEECRLMNFANLWESQTFSNLINRIVDVPVEVARTKGGGVETEVQTRGAPSDRSSHSIEDAKETDENKWHYSSESEFTLLVLLSEVPSGEEDSALEVEIKRRDGSVHAIRFPPGTTGHAVLLQGGVLAHRMPPARFDAVTMVVKIEAAAGWGSDGGDTPPAGEGDMCEGCERGRDAPPGGAWLSLGALASSGFSTTPPTCQCMAPPPPRATAARGSGVCAWEVRGTDGDGDDGDEMLGLTRVPDAFSYARHYDEIFTMDLL